MKVKNGQRCQYWLWLYEYKQRERGWRKISLTLEFGYMATKVFDSGWTEYFGGQGLYWILFNLGRVNLWFQYHNLSVFLGFSVMWIVILFNGCHPVVWY